MYTQSDFVKANKQKKLRVWLFVILCAVFACIMFVFNSMRIQALSILTAVVGFVVAYFLWSFKVSPWVKYDRHLREIKNGQTRTAECEFMYFAPETRLMDGVEVNELIVTVGKEEEDERLYYWDVDKPAPVLNVGDKLIITSYGNFVVELKNA